MINFPMVAWRPPAYTTWVAQDGTGRIATSTNNGTAWTLRSSGLTTTATASKIYRCPGTGVVLAPGAVGGFGCVSRSTDNGVSWAAVVTTFVGNFTAVISNGAGQWLAVGAGGTVWRSTDGGLTWADISANLTTTETAKHLYGLAISPNGRVLAAAVYGLYYTDNFGNTWTQNTSWASPTGLSQYVAKYAMGTFILGSEQVRVYSSPAGVGTPSLAYSSGVASHEMYDLQANTSGSLCVAVSSRSAASGPPRLVSSPTLATWTDISARLPAGTDGAGRAVASGPNGVWLVGFTAGKIARSTDNTATFTDISAAVPFDVQNVTGLMSFQHPDPADLINSL